MLQIFLFESELQVWVFPVEIQTWRRQNVIGWHVQHFLFILNTHIILYCPLCLSERRFSQREFICSKWLKHSQNEGWV